MTRTVKEKKLALIPAADQAPPLSQYLGVEIPSPSLDALDGVAAAADAAAVPPAAPGATSDAPAGEVSIDLPSVIDASTLDTTIEILGERYPVMAFQAKERALLAQVWQKPLDQLYQRVLAWLNTDPAKAGPWAQAATVTIALLAPRVMPRLLDRFLPAPKPDPAPDAETRSDQ